MWIVSITCSPRERPPPVAPTPERPRPGAQLLDAYGRPSLAADPRDLQAAGNDYAAAGELALAHEFYKACATVSEGDLRSDCQWSIGLILVTTGRQHDKHNLEHMRELGIKHPSHKCIGLSYAFNGALSVLRIAHRSRPTAGRAKFIGDRYDELGNKKEALRFYKQAATLNPDDRTLLTAIAELHKSAPTSVTCRPQDCSSLPFDQSRRGDEREVVVPGLEGRSRERIYACFAEPRQFTQNRWSYRQIECASPLRAVARTVHIYFDGDNVERVTVELNRDPHGCQMFTR